MEKIRFIFKKNNNILIDEVVNTIKKDNEFTFTINKEKYIFSDYKLVKENSDNIVILDFKNNISNIILKDINNSLNAKLNIVKVNKNKKNIEIKYNIETEEDSINIIKIEYI